MRIKQSFSDVDNRSQLIVLLERSTKIEKKSKVRRLPSKVTKTPVNTLKSYFQVINRPSTINLSKPTPEILSKDSFLEGLGLKVKSKIHSSPNRKSVKRFANDKVQLVSKPVPVINSVKFVGSSVKSFQLTSITGSSMLLSPMAAKCALETSLTLNKSEPLDDPNDDLLHIDLCSPLGVKMKSLLLSQCQKCTTIRDYDQYCNRLQTHKDSRSLRSQTIYCDDRWNLNNIHYMRLPEHVELKRAIVFGRLDRKERLKRLRTGLNRPSRRLMRQMTPCHVKVIRLNIDPTVERSPSPASITYTCIQEQKTRENLSPSPPAKSMISVTSLSASVTSSDPSYCSCEQMPVSRAKRRTTIASMGNKCSPPTPKTTEETAPHKVSRLIDIGGNIHGMTKDVTPNNTAIKPSFLLKAFTADEPRLELCSKTEEPLLVDLTYESSDDVENGTLIPTVRPSQILGDCRAPQFSFPTESHQLGLKKRKESKVHRRTSERFGRLQNRGRQDILI